MNKGMISISALVVVLLLGISCGKATSFSTCSIKIEDYYGEVTYKSDPRSTIFPEARIWKASDAAVSSLVDVRVPAPEYRNFEFGINSIISTTSETQITVLYLDKSLFDEKSFSEDNIRGVSRFSAHGKSFRHEFFQKIEGRYTRLNEISGEASMITTNTLNLIADKIVFSVGGNTSIVIISNAEFQGEDNKRNADILQKKVKKYLRQKQI